MKSSKSKILSRVLVGIFLVIYYIPLISVVVFSFNKSKSVTHFTGFSFCWYKELFTDKTILYIVAMTFFIAISATIISTIIGTLASIALVKVKSKSRKMILDLNNIPISNADIVTAIGLLLLFVSINVAMGYGTMLISHVAFCTPYIVITVYPKMKSLDPNLMEAALDLGAKPMKAIRSVLIPELSSSIIAGAFMAFAMSFDDFVISYFTGGSSMNISTYLYSLKKITPTFNALATIMMFIIVLKIVWDRFSKAKKERMEDC